MFGSILRSKCQACRLAEYWALNTVPLLDAVVQWAKFIGCSNDTAVGLPGPQGIPWDGSDLSR